MPIIIIASDGTQSEQPIAQGVAQNLGYRLLGPEIMPEIAAHYTHPLDKLTEALVKQPPAWRPGQSKRWMQQLACIEAEVLDRLMADNIVCWGLAAHLYVLGVSHALKVRLLTDSDARAKSICEQRGISLKRAIRWVKDQERKQELWSTAAFGQSQADPSMYDLVINLDQIDPNEAVTTISGAIQFRRFQPMTYSIHSLVDNVLAAKVKLALLASLTDLRVEARDGNVVVTAKALKRERRKKAETIKALAGVVEGVAFVQVHLINYVIREAAQSNR